MRELADLGCFSYVAAADVVHVGALPQPNDGAEILRRRRSLAGDGPLVAAFATGLGLTARLIANGVGSDPDGQFVREFLARNSVEAKLGEAANTPYAFILEDDRADRQWFAELKSARADLATVDLTPLNDTRIRYLDLYPVIEKEAARCLNAPGDLYVNLGGGWPSSATAELLSAARPLVVQTSASSGQVALAKRIRVELGAAIAVVTRAAAGAVAIDDTGTHEIDAPAISITTAHGAGAAFSAGMLSALRADKPTAAATADGCAHASLHCREAAERYRQTDLDALQEET